MSWYTRYVDQANQWTRIADIAFKQGNEDLGLQARDNARAYDALAKRELDRIIRELDAHQPCWRRLIRRG